MNATYIIYDLTLGKQIDFYVVNLRTQKDGFDTLNLVCAHEDKELVSMEARKYSKMNGHIVQVRRGRARGNIERMFRNGILIAGDEPLPDRLKWDRCERCGEPVPPDKLECPACNQKYQECPECRQIISEDEARGYGGKCHVCWEIAYNHKIMEDKQ